MTNTPAKRKKINTGISPWLSVSNVAKALEFYQAAFDATTVYRMDNPEDGSFVARLSVDGAEFWISEAGKDKAAPQTGGEPIRMILTVSDPDTIFQQAINAGATEIFPVGEEYGWRLGRIADPFGIHWEIGYELSH